MRQSLFRIAQSSALALYRAVSASPVLSSGPGRKALAFAYLAYKRWFEAGDAKALKDYVLPGTTVVDVGANIGFFTNQFASWAGRDGLVIAIEPEIRNFAILRSRSERHHPRAQIDLIHGAAAARAGRGLSRRQSTSSRGHHSETAATGCSVPAVDDLVKTRPDQRVSLIKIDVQGHEYGVLLGARGTLQKWQQQYSSQIDDAALMAAGSSRGSNGSCRSWDTSPRSIQGHGTRSIP